MTIKNTVFWCTGGKKVRLNLNKKILATAICPILMVGIVVIVISLTMVKSSLIDEVKNSLKGTAAATLAAYDQNSGEYMQAENGDVWKGGYNISKSEALADSIRNRSGMDVTFFYGKERIMTSAKDKNGDRILGSPAGDVIVERVLNSGEEFFSKAVSLDGTLNYGYYIPVYQRGSSTNPIGMIFVGTDKEAKDAAINRMIWLIIIAVLVVMGICMLIVVIVAFSITGALKESIRSMQHVAKGELGIEVSRKLTARMDEIGDMSKAIQTLQSELQYILQKIAASTKELTSASENLEVTAKDTNLTMKQVESAVSTISQNAIEQAKNTRGTSEHILLMGSQISETAKEVGTLNENADIMRSSSAQAAETIKQLRQINAEVEQSIQTVTRQTNQTNESAQKIREATELITSIAEETNLLSLNASIEAARAGESGRGFAVVASQIQKLAEQSNESSRTIEEITNALMTDSSVAVDTMKHVQEIIDNQSRNMQDTENIVSEVMRGINTSLKSIEQIDKTTVMLETSRNRIVQTVEELSDIAQQNASSTQQTSAQTVVVANTFGQIEHSAQELKRVAEEISNAMRHFHL